MRTEKLKAVQVCIGDVFNEYFAVGFGNVTAIEWGRTKGVGDWCDTVRVFKDGKLHSEHPFCNCLGVYFAEDS